MTDPRATPEEWFREAVRCYGERHQGCPWCGGSNRVYRTQYDGQLEYYCGGCDFYVRHDLNRGQHFMSPGRRPPNSTVPPTLHASIAGIQDENA